MTAQYSHDSQYSTQMTVNTVLTWQSVQSSQIKCPGVVNWYGWVQKHVLNHARNILASFPGHRRNGLVTSVSSNCYFCCQKVCSTNQISEHCHMTTVNPNCVMHWNITVMPIPFEWLIALLCMMIVFFEWFELVDWQQECPILAAGKKVSRALIQYWLLKWATAVTVTLHPYTVWTRGISQAVSPTAWKWG